ncbi:MAG: DUF885 domain-containing protein [Gammaproteobacteria bacterium]|nr:DUF885 domain-containing protein [Gammaproteobacteria bacterium]NNC97136.1 DUF885 domain-containing protein [Gammaproteobacteria bacterium]NNM13624.1 DUF885 domain-containing protein [Gammaproteobacteria bacterium]
MLEALFDAEWQRDLANNPVGASMLGDKRYNHRWPDLSLENLAQNRAKDQATLDQLANIKREQLSAANRLNYDLFKQGYVDRLKESRFERYLIPLNQRGGIQTQDTMLDSLRFSNKKDYLDWIARLESFPNYMQQTIDLMKAGQTKNILPPKVIMQRIPDQIQLQLVDSPEESGFYKPFKNKPDFIKPSEWKSLQSRAAANIQAGVIPAYKKFHAFINNEYLPACRDTVGVWDSPDGQAFYQQRVKRFTTTELSYDEIHQIGLSEVKRIRSEMQKIIDDLEFDGSFNDFLTFLRTDKQFYYATPEELETAYLATSKRIDPELVKLFGKLPRMPYGIKKIPDSIAPDTTTAYYSRPAADGSRAGFYYVNLYKPETRPKYEIEVLSVHEAMPGHHLQIALAMELGDLPNFRKLGGFTAFVEGWGLYSESLGGDLGLYKDPYSKFGQLTYEMWRAVRLVVDTGMHAKQWTRQQAIDFFKANAAKTEHDIVNEIDRYIAWPGQALAYKIGELKIKELRARAEKQLGEDFDVREFHDLVLSQGAIPLNILENTIDAWLANK